jgi:hypothetical protein
MSDLWAAPFSLTYDSLVRAKVLAHNKRGWSEASEAYTVGAKIQVKPLDMNATMSGPLTEPTQIDVYWNSTSFISN